jgi:S-adenosylmethionine-diacylglycerol 3-amino-3-carboxypropyl transferase
VAERLLARARYALTALDPADNPYLHWILTGRHTTALPFALRLENFELIRDNLDRLEWRCLALEEFLDTVADGTFAAFNLSDIFEYISTENYHRLLEQLVRVGRSGARLAYWNTLADRHRPEFMADRLRSLDDLSRSLHAQDKAFFYCAFFVEEIV